MVPEKPRKWRVSYPSYYGLNALWSALPQKPQPSSSLRGRDNGSHRGEGPHSMFGAREQDHSLARSYNYTEAFKKRKHTAKNKILGEAYQQRIQWTSKTSNLSVGVLGPRQGDKFKDS